RLMVGDHTRRAASLLFTPLCQGDRVVGVLSVQSYTFNAYNEEHRDFIQGIASQVTIALENARLFERTEKNLQRMQALHEIDKSISSTHDLQATFDTYLTHLMAQLGVDAAAILLLHEATQTLEYAAGRGFRTQALQHTRLRVGEGIAGRVALERRIQIIPDLEKDKADLARSPHLAEEGFVTYFGAPLIAKGQLSGVLEIFHRHPVSPDHEWLAYLETLATQAAIAVENMMLFSDLQRSNSELSLAYDTTLEGWSRALDLRDQETEGHTQRVTEMAVGLGRQAGIRDNELVHLRRGALLHDIGKMGIPDSILLKPGPLTPDEWETMRQHPVIAYRLLSPIAHLRFALDIPYCHHEKWDGSGYPRALRGEEIPFVARLFAVVDVWDALCSDRPYRPAWEKEKVWQYIQSEAGKHFDPKVVEIFLKAATDEA
ncbi:MAG TPA: HD domain-containing phosphohydrolase, partial [Anaerolineae bacterium]